MYNGNVRQNLYLCIYLICFQMRTSREGHNNLLSSLRDGQLKGGKAIGALTNLSCPYHLNLMGKQTQKEIQIAESEAGLTLITFLYQGISR